MKDRVLHLIAIGFIVPAFLAQAEALQPTEPFSSLPTYVPSAVPSARSGSNLSSLTPHCEGCRVLIPDKTKPRPGSRGFHRPPRHQGSRYTRLKNGKHLKFKPAGVRRQSVQLPRRALTRLGLMARHFESWQVQAVDGDTIRYGTERIRLRGMNAPELSEPGGIQAQQRLAELLSQGNINIIPHGQDVYGRMLADVFIGDRNVADIMTAEGYAKRG
jgi:micrococcal nuclease